MFKKNLIKKLNIKFKTFYFYEYNNLFLRSFVSDLRFYGNIRFYFFLKLNNFDINLTRLNYICIKTFKYKSFINFFNISRINFRDNVLFAKYSGIKKASW